MKLKFLFILFLASLIFANKQSNAQDAFRPVKWAQPVKGLKLNNIYKVDEGIYRAEQPNNEEFKELEKFGIKEALNLRFWYNDAKEADGTKLILHRVNMNAHDINNHDIIEALRIIKNRKGDILVHCKHGSDRTGAVFAMYRIIFQGWSKEAAIEEMKQGGYGYHRIYFNIVNYIYKADIDKLEEQVFAKINVNIWL
ncbi:MAG: tyrosine-protein phosphatase [Prevotellaceae bacterium]|jgi:protein tyrosine/serine phosphatase|nr:tyrosine-protein phosphatase [Prevotellaceae bacterium]